MSAQSRCILGDRLDVVVGSLVLGGLAVAALAAALLHVVAAGLTWQSAVIAAVVPVTLLGAVAITAAWRLGGHLTPADVLRTTAWSVGFTLMFAFGASASIVYQVLEGGSVVHPWFVVVGWATGGAFVGILFGWYAAGQRSMRRAADHERDRAERLAQRLSVLNRVLRHDVRNGSNVILGYADLVEAEHGHSEHVSKIVREATRLCDLSDNARRVESLLDDEDAVTDQSLSALLDEPIARLENRYPGAEVTYDCDLSVRVRAHELAGTAVWNVLENAVVHNESDEPAVTVETAVGEERVVVTVADDGPGIPARERRILAADEETQLDHSLGMGLWMSQWILQEAGGDLRVGGGDDGATVELVFPRA